jgi:hypothetical protein
MPANGRVLRDNPEVTESATENKPPMVKAWLIVEVCESKLPAYGRAATVGKGEKAGQEPTA